MWCPSYLELRISIINVWHKSYLEWQLCTLFVCVQIDECFLITTWFGTPVLCIEKYSWTSMTRTPIRHFPWLIWNRALVPRNFFRQFKGTNIQGYFVELFLFYYKTCCVVSLQAIPISAFNTLLFYTRSERTLNYLHFSSDLAQWFTFELPMSRTNFHGPSTHYNTEYVQEEPHPHRL